MQFSQAEHKSNKVLQHALQSSEHQTERIHLHRYDRFYGVRTKDHRTKDHYKCQPRTRDHSDKRPPGQKFFGRKVIINFIKVSCKISTELDIARLDKARPNSKGGQRET